MSWLQKATKATQDEARPMVFRVLISLTNVGDCTPDKRQVFLATYGD